MIRGVTVTVVRIVGVTGYDRFNNPINATAAPETVDNVLVEPSTTSDLEAARPEGVRVDYRLHFPKGYDSVLDGALITLPAPWSCTCRVIGNPQPYIDANCPTPWHMTVECEVAHG